jgi:HPt (histidine-containing phosphotransfer) domain-containing protein
MPPDQIPSPPSWTSPVAVGVSAVIAVALAAGLGTPAPLVMLSIPASMIGYRAGWRAGSQSGQAPAAVETTASVSVAAPEPIVAPAPEPVAAPQPTAPRQWVDEAAVLERMGGSMEILMELTVLFADENVRRLADLRAALAAGDALQVSREAHGIKSGLTNFCADDAVALAFNIEHAGKAGSLEGLAGAIDVLEVALSEVTEQLTAMGKAA